MGGETTDQVVAREPTRSARRKITHLTSVHPPFDSRIFHKECKSMVAAGFDVSLVAVHERDEIREGVTVLSLPTPRSRPDRMTRIASELFRRARLSNADIYHFHDPELIPVGIALKLTGRRVVYDVHEDVALDLLSKDYLPGWARRPLARLLAWLNRMADRVFDGIVVVTPSTGAPFRAPTLIRNYAILDEFTGASIPYRSRPYYAVYVGRIGPSRGYPAMRRAAEIAATGSNRRLLLAGLADSAELRNELESFPAGSPVEYAGVVDRPGVRDILHAARLGLVVLPTETASFIDAYPVKLFEYMAAGLPVIASDFPVYRDIVEGAGCGILVDPGDVQAVARAMDWIFEHPAEAEAMGARGQQAALERYNWESEAPKLIALYEAIVDG